MSPSVLLVEDVLAALVVVLLATTLFAYLPGRDFAWGGASLVAFLLFLLFARFVAIFFFRQ